MTARAATVLAGLACCCAGAPAAAEATSGVSMRPSFLPDRLGASTAFTLALRFSGGEEGVPPPLRRLVVRLPAGLTIDVRGVKTCPPARLRRRGPGGCPSGSLLGRGHALLEVHAGSQTLPEEVTLSVFRGPSRAGLPTFEIFGQGETPLDRSEISTEILETDRAPFGWRTVTSVPPIPTVMYEPDASYVSLSLTFGGRRTPRAHVAAGAVVVPRRCPAGGFPFAAEATFADHTTARATATVACP
ncbi:MAG TPA: hypothetical protein VES65_05230 [Solirubrobacteraceae bacterium]|nr:hypothetical protein [Solirubrobacteraceae bacterium]